NQARGSLNGRSASDSSSLNHTRSKPRGSARNSTLKSKAESLSGPRSKSKCLRNMQSPAQIREPLPPCLQAGNVARQANDAPHFQYFVENTYQTDVLPLMAKSTQDRYRGIINRYLFPAFGRLCLRDLGFDSLQHFFTQLKPAALSYESRDKIRDVLSSILQAA